MMKYLMMASLWAIALCCNALPQGSAEQAKPNVVFIIADDLMKQVELYGDDRIKTPALSQLAKESLLFDRAYAQYPLCGPSRASMLLSKFPTNTGITWNKIGKSTKTQQKAKELGIQTMPAYFRSNGYTTIGGGKLYHDGTTPNRLGVKNDFTVVLASTGQDGKKVRADQYKPREGQNNKKKGKKEKMTLISQASDYGDYEHKDGTLIKEAKTWLNNYAGKKEQAPFFMALGLRKPHSPFSAPKRFFDMYQRDNMKISDIKAPRDILSHYSLNKSTTLLSVHADTMQYTADTLPDSKKREIMHGYSACVSYIDFLVGDLIATLKSKGLYENTIIVFTSDHGYKLGEYNRWAKYSLMEKDLVVPLMMRVPQQKKTHGASTDALVGLIDLYPTLAELTGIPAPQGLDGVSFAKALTSNGDARDYIHSVVTRTKIVDENGDAQPRALGSSIINRDGYRYTQWSEGIKEMPEDSEELLGTELYDHYNQQNTPISIRNIAKDKPKLLQKMQDNSFELK